MMPSYRAKMRPRSVARTVFDDRCFECFGCKRLLNSRKLSSSTKYSGMSSTTRVSFRSVFGETPQQYIVAVDRLPPYSIQTPGPPSGHRQRLSSTIESSNPCEAIAVNSTSLCRKFSGCALTSQSETLSGTSGSCARPCAVAIPMASIPARTEITRMRSSIRDAPDLDENIC